MSKEGQFVHDTVADVKKRNPLYLYNPIRKGKISISQNIDKT